MKANIAKLSKLVKTVTSGFFQPLRDLAKWTKKVTAKKVLPDIPAQDIYDHFMMDYNCSQGDDCWATLREARLQQLNKSEKLVTDLDIAMVVRKWLIDNGTAVENFYATAGGKKTALVRLQNSQDAAKLVIDFYK